LSRVAEPGVDLADVASTLEDHGIAAAVVRSFAEVLGCLHAKVAVGA